MDDKNEIKIEIIRKVFDEYDKVPSADMEDMIRNIRNIVMSEEKDWRDAFIEKFKAYPIKKVNYSCADAIQIMQCGTCTYFNVLMKYVLQFDGGGFWLENGKLFLVTRGSDSDKKATYTRAKRFIEEILK